MSGTVCERTSEDLVAFLDDELSAAERRPVSEHLGSCLVCRREMERLATLQGWLADLPAVEPSTTFSADFERRLAAEPTPIAPRRGGAGRLRWIVPGLAAAAVLVLALRSFVTTPAPSTAPDTARKRAIAAAPVPAPAAEEEPARVATRPATEKGADQVAGVDALRPEDLPPQLLEHPELFLRLPVVKRLDTLEYLGSLHENGDPPHADDGAG